ncbi:hypothetical protein [Nocardia aurantiaca]|uniref:WXG100 family type VII secretion target n=1 Tax=Nocardia aurantiaca TaxID=2675850 RepID=A0A6I3KLU6_9NOCA|nr:hypothetical protein [Nocardia aurantiaca]MTE11563.1 hypothetical protein [Nocardia aurantiaca]
MTDKVQVEIAGMRSTADGLDSASTQIDAILATVDAAWQAHNGCWGDDEYGRPFNEGDGGYTKRATNLEDVLKSKAARLREYSAGLRDGATSLEIAEANNVDGFKY